MNFYKTVSIIAIVILIISLAIIGTTLAGSQKNMQYPPNVTECPDLYIKNNEKEVCVLNSSAKDAIVTNECKEKDFNSTDYTYPGIGFASGMCNKKKWAKECNVDWDGITNNPEICYSTNE